MTQAVQFLFNGLRLIINTLNLCVFEFYGVDVTLWNILLALFVISVFANVWWKGAKG